MTDSVTNTPSIGTESIEAPVVTPSITGVVKILLTVMIVMGIAIVVLIIMLLGKNNSGATDNTLITTNPSVNVTATSAVTPTINSQSKKVSMTAYNAEIYIPNGWNYTYIDVGKGDGGYYFVDENGKDTFGIQNFDGGILDHFCTDGTAQNTLITVAGIQETISNCYVNGKLTLSYGWFNHASDGYAYSSTNELSDQYRSILGTISYTY